MVMISTSQNLFTYFSLDLELVTFFLNFIAFDKNGKAINVLCQWGAFG